MRRSLSHPRDVLMRISSRTCLFRTMFACAPAGPRPDQLKKKGPRERGPFNHSQTGGGEPPPAFFSTHLTMRSGVQLLLLARETREPKATSSTFVSAA